MDFRIIAGEKVRICGENGRGKTTLIQILGTLLM
ncbi:MAG: ATP-binding cassette domain-containing protein [Lachnospiraceae bacterium]